MNELISRVATSIFLIIILYFSFFYNIFFLILLIIVFLTSVYEFYQLVTKGSNLKKYKNSLVILFILYLIFVFIVLNNQIHDNKYIIFYFILVCVVTDVGGLLAGKTFKGKKLTKISPNKTYSGFYGSIISSILLMFVSIPYMNLNLLSLFLFTLSLSLLSQFGDLFFSYLKRKAKVKDTGNILPGHGGLLDRIDGMIISVPINLIIYIISS